MQTHASSSPPCTLPDMAAKSDKPRDERLELRLTADDKALIERAAALTGESVGSFTRRAAITEARVTIARLEK